MRVSDNEPWKLRALIREDRLKRLTRERQAGARRISGSKACVGYPPTAMIATVSRTPSAVIAMPALIAPPPV